MGDRVLKRDGVRGRASWKASNLAGEQCGRDRERLRAGLDALEVSHAGRLQGERAGEARYSRARLARITPNIRTGPDQKNQHPVPSRLTTQASPTRFSTHTSTPKRTASTTYSPLPLKATYASPNSSRLPAIPPVDQPTDTAKARRTSYGAKRPEISSGRSRIRA